MKRITIILFLLLSLSISKVYAQASIEDLKQTVDSLQNQLQHLQTEFDDLKMESMLKDMKLQLSTDLNSINLFREGISICLFHHNFDKRVYKSDCEMYKVYCEGRKSSYNLYLQEKELLYMYLYTGKIAESRTDYYLGMLLTIENAFKAMDVALDSTKEFLDLYKTQL